MVIYIDILVILNMFVDYFLLLGCCVLLKTDIKKVRLIFGALVGGIFSLVIVLPDLNIFINFFIKMLIAVILVVITFGFKSRANFLKTFLIFFAENLIFVGAMFLLWMFFAPTGMYFRNGFTYISISPVVLIFGSMAAYIFTYIINFCIARAMDSKKIYNISLKFNDRYVVLKALYDSGNCLLEPFSGKPVCVCEYEKISNIFPAELTIFFEDYFKNIRSIESSRFKKYIKLIPSNTIVGSAILPAFLPQEFYILGDSIKKKFDCYVAVVNKKISDGEYNAIIGDFN